MNKIIHVLLSLVLILLTACNDDEIEALKAEQEALSNRVLALETWQKQVTVQNSPLRAT